MFIVTSSIQLCQRGGAMPTCQLQSILSPCNLSSTYKISHMPPTPFKEENGGLSVQFHSSFKFSHSLSLLLLLLLLLCPQMQNKAEQPVRTKMQELRLICDKEIPIQQHKIDSAVHSFLRSLETLQSKAHATVENQGPF